MDKKELFICECNSIEHQMIMSYFDDEKEVYCSVHLKPERNVFKRIIHAVKYIFGHRSIYGYFEAQWDLEIRRHHKQCHQQQYSNLWKN